MSFPVCLVAVFQLAGSVMGNLTARLQRMRWPAQLPVYQEGKCIPELQIVDRQMMRYSGCDLPGLEQKII